MNIEFDSNKNRFLVHTQPSDLSVVRNFPSRKWNPRQGYWTVPKVRRNMEYLHRVLDSGRAECTPEVTQVVEEYSRAAEQVIPIQPFPISFPYKTKPFPHQREALDRINNRHAMGLFLEMGLGKSKVALDYTARLMMDNEVDACVIFCPVSIRRTWEKEIQTHMACPVDVAVVDLSSRQAMREVDWLVTLPKRKILICGIESLSQGFKKGRAFDAASRFLTVNRCITIVDEAHLIKTHNANRSKNIVSLGTMAEYRLALTGTPMTQGPMDLFMIYEYLDPDVLGFGDFYSYRARYAEMGGFEGKQIVGYCNVDELTELLGPYSVSMTKAEHLSLPEKLYTQRFVSLTKEQKKAYHDMRTDRIAKIPNSDESKMAENVLAMYTELSKIIAGYMTDDEGKVHLLTQPDRHPKVVELMNVLDETPGQVIVWCKLLHEITLVEMALAKAGITVVTFTGQQSNEERDAAVEKFLSGEARVFLGTPASGGVGLTLNCAHTVVYMSNSYQLVHRLQSEDRCHRIGQTNNVLYVDILAEDTIDVAVQAALQGKQSLIDYVREEIKTNGLKGV